MDQIDALAKRVLQLYSNSTKEKRLLISIAGIPGSGKSTITSKLIKKINESATELKLIGPEEPIAVLIPQDGYHYYREELSKFADPTEAFNRRGAPFTFNSKSFLELIERISIYDGTQVIHVPSFDHSLKDPVENSYKIDSSIRIVLLEGNYVQLKDPVWCDISKYCKEKWFIDADINNVRERIIKRHLEAGISSSREEAEFRVDNNDLINGIYILEHSQRPDLVLDNH